MDNKTKTGPADAARINVHEDYEVRYWSEALGVTPDRLKKLVEQFGTSAAAVRDAVKK